MKLLVSSLLCGVVVWGQNPTLAGGGNPNIFRAALGNSAVYEGDSLTSGFGLSKSADGTTACRTVADVTCLDWPSQLQFFSAQTGRVTKNNIATAGAQIATLQARYTASVHPLSPAVTGLPATLFLDVGSNDVGGSSAATIEAAFTTYWAGAKTDGFTLVVGTIPRRGDANGKIIGANTTRIIVNSWIRSQLSAGTYDILMDWDKILSSPFDSLIFQSDFIHPAAAGHFLLAKMINSIILSDAVMNVTSNDVVVGTGTENVRCNEMALYGITSGIQNTACGWRAGEATTTGQKNTSIGYLSGTSGVALSDNTAVGWGALFTNTGGSDNTCIGNGACVSGASHSQNTVVGSLAANNANAGGVGNVTVGYSAGQQVSGNGNICIGYTTCGSDAMSGGNGIAIGNAARATAAGSAQIGAGTNSTANTIQFQGFVLTKNVAAGTAALGTGAISSATCATVVTVAATGTLTTDILTASFNSDPTATTGFIPAVAGMLTIISYPTADNVNFKVCNNTIASITPGAVTLNWKVTR